LTVPYKPAAFRKMEIAAGEKSAPIHAEHGARRAQVFQSI
jgi:hypothetical protein